MMGDWGSFMVEIIISIKITLLKDLFPFSYVNAVNIFLQDILLEIQKFNIRIIKLLSQVTNHLILLEQIEGN